MLCSTVSDEGVELVAIAFFQVRRQPSISRWRTFYRQIERQSSRMLADRIMPFVNDMQLSKPGTGVVVALNR